MTTSAFAIGAEQALRKLASLDATVHDVVNTALKAHLPKGKGPSPDDELETLLPEDGDLEAVITALEENFDVTLPSDDVFALFAEGTVADLEKLLVKHLTAKKPSKTASWNSKEERDAYYRNRERVAARIADEQATERAAARMRKLKRRGKAGLAIIAITAPLVYAGSKVKERSKTAAYDSHAYYMRNRARRRQQARQYRMRNLHQIRRKSRIYRAQVSRGARRPRRRIGAAGAGYSYIPR